MTTGTTRETPARLLTRWAAEQLKLEADVSVRDARCAFMVRLRDEDFMPPYRWQQAYQVLATGTCLPELVGQALQDEEQRLGAAVGAFAVEFFTLDVARRTQRWQELMGQCALMPPLAARLRDLERGLKVRAETAGDTPAVRELADNIRELFVLRPGERAVRRQELMKKYGPDDIPRLGQAARQIVTLYPALAALEANLLDRLSTWTERVARRTQGRRRREKAAAAATQGSSGGYSWQWVWVFIVVALLRACAGGGGTSRNYSPPPYQLPTVPDFKDWERKFLEKNRPDPVPDPNEFIGPLPADQEERRKKLDQIKERRKKLEETLRRNFPELRDGLPDPNKKPADKSDSPAPP